MNEVELGKVLAEMAQNLITIAGGLYCGNVFTHKNNLYKLSKFEERLLVDKLPDTKQLTARELRAERNRIKMSELKLLKEAIRVLEENVDFHNLQTLYKNLKTVEVVQSPMLRIMGMGGSYNGRNNKLSYSAKSSIEHELLHLASTIYDEKTNTLLSGFWQLKDGASIGRAINEGYTELLTRRYFNKDGKSYKAQVRIARMLELFFDDPKEMERLYFTSNLPGLIKYFEKYSDREDIIDFIVANDRMLQYYHEFSSLPTITSINIQLKLNEWFEKKNAEQNKAEEFYDILNQNRIVKTLLK